MLQLRVGGCIGASRLVGVSVELFTSEADMLLRCKGKLESAAASQHLVVNTT